MKTTESESYELEGTFKRRLVQLPYNEQGHLQIEQSGKYVQGLGRTQLRNGKTFQGIL